MAIKSIMLGKKLRAKELEKEALRKKLKTLDKREAELKKRIDGTTAPDEELEQQVEELTDEQEEIKDELLDVIEAIEAIKEELEKIEGEEVPVDVPDTVSSARGVAFGEQYAGGLSNTRARNSFDRLPMSQRSALVKRDDVHGFIDQFRAAGKNKRAISGAELTIPDVLLDLIRENIEGYSKLLSKVRLRKIKGTSRQNIMGTIPEAVWTEACASINELAFGFNQLEMDGYKVAGFIPICNATLEDSELNLASEIIDVLGQSIGLGVDKAILYGTGLKMPIGIVTRLAQSAKPSDYSAKARPWESLVAKHIVALGTSAKPLKGIELYQGFIRAAAAAKSTYSQGEKFWAMNETTFTELVAEALSINAAGAIVTGQNNTFPVIGGDIVLLPFIPDGDVIGGYGDMYSVAERAGIHIMPSEHVRFLEDQTVYRGTARYDGKPAIPESFVLINILGQAPTKTMAFADDAANTVTNP